MSIDSSPFAGRELALRLRPAEERITDLTLRFLVDGERGPLPGVEALDVHPSVLLHPSVPTPDGERMYELLTRHIRRDPGCLVYFTDQLPAGDSDLAQQMVRDPYVFDFLDLTDRAAERDLESALLERLRAFLLELGHGFAFIGRQYHLEVDGDDFYIDLLFFNWAQSRFVVVELKVGRFQPEHLGKLSFYVAWVDDHLRRPGQHAPTVGILLCAGRNDSVVRYSLAGAAAPLAVAGFTYETLPASARSAVPTDGELAAAVTEAMTQGKRLAACPLEDEKPGPGQPGMRSLVAIRSARQGVQTVRLRVREPAV